MQTRARSRAAEAASPPAAAGASSPPETSETATVVGSTTSRGGMGVPLHQAVALTSVAAPAPAESAASTRPAAPSTSAAAGEPAPLPPASASGAEDGSDEADAVVAELLLLKDRIPDVQTVIQAVKKDHIVISLLEDFAVFFPSESEQAVFYQTQLWEEVSGMLTGAIVKYTPVNEKDIDRKSKRFEDKKNRIVDDYIAERGEELFAELGEGEEDKLVAGLGILLHIGRVFLRCFQKLIVPPGGTEAVSIPAQIKTVLAEFSEKPLGELFPKQISKHVYYIIGFLCAAGQKEAGRRSKTKDVGKCIKALDAHFAQGRDEAAVAKIREDLPDGVTALVDKRCHFGGLKYPNKQLYSVFVLMEKVYSVLATPYNFAIFGGTLLGEICDGMLENEDLVAQFSELFEPDAFDYDSIHEAMRYYVKVFGNVRAKDLCYRYNSNIQRGATVGIRQRVASHAIKSEGNGKQSAKKKKKKATKRKTQQEAEPTTSDDEPEVLEEEVASEKQQHNAMNEIANEILETDEDKRKECTIHPHDSSHMED